MAGGSSITSDPDSADWQTQEGIPQHTDQFIQQYFHGREALIEQEKAQRSDYVFRQTLTPLAVEACAILSRIRAEEQRMVWTGYADGNTDGGERANVHAGMIYTLAKEIMETTKSWQIVKKMPKGALLHGHWDAMIDVDWLIDLVLATDGITMQADQALNSSEARVTGLFHFQFCEASPNNVTSIWDENYQAKEPIPVKSAAEKFPAHAVDGFKAWLRDRCTITQPESLKIHEGPDAIWAKFKDCFAILHSMLFYEPVFRASMQRLLRELMADGIRWVDFRMAFVFEYRREGFQEPETTYHEFYRVFGEEVERFQASEEGKRFWGARFIWSTLRSFDTRQVVASMKECISVKKAYPDLIAGFDVVGQEDMGRSLADLTPEFFWFRKQCMEEGVEIPFFFHAGECLGDGDETDQNLFDAILLGSRRIGHGFSLYKHPLLVEMVKQKKILIEVCPISNEILRLTSSIKTHPAPALLSRGVAVALCNDDPAILGHGRNGSTDDFWQALQGWENLGLEGLGSIAADSVRYAAYAPDQTSREWNKDVRDGVFGEGVRAARLREWTSEWNQFCEWVVMEYAADYGSDGD